MKTVLKITITLLFFAHSFAQKVLTHKVKEGDNLYSLAKNYNTSVDEIMKLNAKKSEALRLGEILKIKSYPKPIDPQERVYFSDNTGTATVHHFVSKGETLSAIAEKYETTIAKILSYNTHLSETVTLNLNDEVIVVTTTEAYKNSKKGKTTIKNVQSDAVKQDKDIIKPQLTIKSSDDGEDTFNNEIVVELPMYNANDVLNHIKSINCQKIKPLQQGEKTFYIALFLPFNLKEKNQQTKVALNFYQGAMAAIDTLKRQGISAKVFIYDTKEGIDNIFAKEEFQKMDLVIGPLYSEDFALAYPLALAKNIPIVTPFSNQMYFINNKPLVFKTTASFETELEKMANIIDEKFNMYHVIYLTDSSSKNTETIEKNLEKNIKSTVLKENFKTLTSLENSIKPQQKNLIILPSSASEDFNKLIDIIDAYKKIDTLETTRIEVFGFESISKLKFQKDAFEYIKYYFLDQNYIMNTRAYNNVNNRFQGIYHTAPSKHMFKGFDITFFFLNNIWKYGKNFLYCSESQLREKSITTGFDFKRINGNSGFENKYFDLIKYNGKDRIVIP